MRREEEEKIIKELKIQILDTFPLSKLSDEELHEAIEKLVAESLNSQYVPIGQTAEIVGQIYSSIRGFGLLDAIMQDDSITEVMINGTENIFVEQNGVSKRLDQKFENEKQLEDIIQRIVGRAGREVTQASPIVDTRLPDGSRVNVVLPPISLCGPVVTVRKFSKEPMTIEKLISYDLFQRKRQSF